MKKLWSIPAAFAANSSKLYISKLYIILKKPSQPRYTLSVNLWKMNLGKKLDVQLKNLEINKRREGVLKEGLGVGVFGGRKKIQKLKNAPLPCIKHPRVRNKSMIHSKK